MNNLLLDDYPLVILPKLAVKIGLNDSIVLQQIHYWVEVNKKAKRNFVDGHHWTYNTYEEWQEQFPFWSIRTIKGIMSSLLNAGLIITGAFNKMKMDRTKWYRINYEKLEEICFPSCKYCTMDSANIAPPIPETNTKTIKMDDDARFSTSRTGHYLDREQESDDKINRALSYYYYRYEEKMHSKHPFLKVRQLERIYESFDYVVVGWNEPETQIKKLIDMWFDYDTQTNYNLNHFATPNVLHTRMETLR